MSIENQVIAIVGATGGIGSVLARRLHTAGARVAPLGRDPRKLAELTSALSVEGFECDASSFEQVDEAIQRVVASHGRLDGAVNCAGSLILKPAHITSEAEYRATLAANLDSSFSLVRASARVMNARGGSIVLVSTAAARMGLANHEAIAAAKGGVIGLTLSAAATYAARGIRVNCVAPGLTDTPLAARITSNEASLKASQAMYALGRIGRPEEVASAIAWLLDPENCWVTGQVLGVDGGLASVRPR